MFLQVAPGEVVHFDGTEIAIVTALLATVAGAVTVLFRQLLGAERDRATVYADELVALRKRLDQALADRADVEHQLVGAFGSALKENTKAMQEMVAEFRDLSATIKAQHHGAQA